MDFMDVDLKKSIKKKIQKMLCLNLNQELFTIKYLMLFYRYKYITLKKISDFEFIHKFVKNIV